ncbi:hypothetical protein ILUMI_08322 [Ignelater luminosus]|uniref:Mutator-like transposase domain-containing protein n=1 Tax=Ignelater luminosus TaxID=2038154 RepID=A0A8K0D5V2_IGNLU|nr:hypothetical protein ILUMI_08322 [Ignelater luminosus]
MCCEEFKIPAIETNENLLNINSAAVEGITSIGGGYYNLVELLSCLEIPSFSEKLFKKHTEIIGKGWEIAAVQEMEAAAKKEAERGKVKTKNDRNAIKHNGSEDPDYSIFCQKEDMDNEEFEKQKKIFLDTIKKRRRSTDSIC